MSSEPRDGRAGIDAALVRRLIATQFPQWRQLPVRPVPHDGWDNRTYRLGDELTVRLPSHASYAPAVAKEHRWLPLLAPRLPVPIPVPVGLGEPSADYPLPWSVRRWLPGEPATAALAGSIGFAEEVAGFVRSLRGIDSTDGPAAGAHSFYRGASLAHYDDEARQAIAALADRPDAGLPATDRIAEVWTAALATDYRGAPAWFHGDIAIGNLLVRDGELAAVIDFGTSGVGDPACDLVIAWTLFTGAARRALRAGVATDDASWARARGWALWKALITLRAALDGDPVAGADGSSVAANRRIVNDLVSEHSAGKRSTARPSRYRRLSSAVPRLTAPVPADHLTQKDSP